jgi:serine protease inhibitor
VPDCEACRGDEHRRTTLAGGRLEAIGDGTFTIEEIRHKAIIDVAEDGIAATAVVVVKVSSIFPPREPRYEPFLVDYPILFFVLDQSTRAVLFEGRVIDPSKPA